MNTIQHNMWRTARCARVGRQVAALPSIVASLSLVLISVALITLPASASDPCNPPNLIPQPVCDFDDFYGEIPLQIPNGWQPFTIFGSPQYVNDPHSLFGTGTLRMMTNDSSPFKAGIFTQVSVTPGAGYRASASWAAPNWPTDAWGRQLGIDPTGGTDPNSPNIVWGPIHYGDGRIVNYPVGEGPNIDVLARAINSTVTVFFLADLRRIEGANLIYVDVIALYPDENAPAANAPVAIPATDTPAPAAPPPAEAAPQPLAKSDASADSQISAASVAVAQPAEPLTIFVGAPDLPTETATETPPPALTAAPVVEVALVAPTATMQQVALLPPTADSQPTPTWTALPTVMPASALNIGSAQTEVMRVLDDERQRPLALVSVISLLGSVIFGGSLWWMRRR